MKLRDLKELTVEELYDKRKEMYRELLNLRHQVALRKLDNPSRIRFVRRGIARVLTLIRNMEM
ncbi:50S ribosomal protein L29 [Candidatus Desantisbacteria bacterium CG2_30_40_21]|uniref:Large ribosomal subunit protein uL29 n=5 Tax=unclassified Candidatus Desantisiibacteriota TaxID=3106372 RepID=A0A2M7JF07_9BACT|nr:MAG: 50S ribosomal protein L29 [Candidatus Desantisbacteria bacterium CG2_30_40_21]PIP39390.1 MAG: 50S ribosomal protein L29 [Candidatus Desantisbacteria bacterium CG23_combo_of_CG06-09_8_20_14_all_40_23]PIX17994.1 MAG: 50S ribosomal protein L29 [Candidatus Desantisbacteria bacterium CG_4_8_14_3_um_filter_40_12]PIY19562.1 MAG: 50S ribosomal protein L29 [Candidatus Desantisbacteria bacterium CG_4_10_14_3_um_filter_40_18]PJB30209.1 MAG: 50S ribosomal protein L29 [Candidatus Desantisbacteria ba